MFDTFNINLLLFNQVMNGLLFSLLGYISIYFIYLFGKVLFSVRFGICEDHIFLGFGAKPVLSFQLLNTRVSLGVFIPLPFLARFHGIRDGRKERVRFEWEYFDHVPAQRLLVVYGGVIAMLFSSMTIFSILEFNRKDRFIGKEEVDKFGIYPSNAAKQYGFLAGDRIVSIDGVPLQTFEELNHSINYATDTITFEVARGQEILSINVDRGILLNNEWGNEERIFYLNAPFKILSVNNHSAADEAGLKSDDIIRKIDDVNVSSIHETKAVLESSKGDSVLLQVDRMGSEILLKAKVSEDGKLGFRSQSLINYSIEKKSILQAIKAGISKPFKLIKSNFNGLKIMLNGGEYVSKRNQKLSGPIGIAAQFGDGNLYLRFFTVLATLLSVFTIYEILPLPRSATFRSIPIWLEIIFRKKISFDSFQKLKKASWAIPISFCLYIFLKDMLMMF